MLLNYNFTSLISRVEAETSAMAKDLGVRTQQLQQYLVALSKYIETSQVGRHDWRVGTILELSFISLFRKNKRSVGRKLKSWS